MWQHTLKALMFKILSYGRLLNWHLSTHYMHTKKVEGREWIDGKSADTRMMIMPSASERILGFFNLMDKGNVMNAN